MKRALEFTIVISIASMFILVVMMASKVVRKAMIGCPAPVIVDLRASHPSPTIDPVTGLILTPQLPLSSDTQPRTRTQSQPVSQSVKCPDYIWIYDEATRNWQPIWQVPKNSICYQGEPK